MEQVPFVSVIIPCRNEEQFIGRSLQTVRAWDTTGCQLEILVVDGRSTDGTREIVAEYAARDRRIRLLDNPRQVKPAALNIGLRVARGKWILRLDAHSEYAPDYLRQCLETARRTGADNVGGVFIPRLSEDTVQAHLVRALTTHFFGVGGSRFRTNAHEGPADTVAYGCYRREVFERIGRFNERLVHSQDFEFNQRLLRAGGRIWLNPAIRVFYYNQATLRNFFRKFVNRDGPWNPYMWWLAPWTFQLRHVVPMIFVLGLVATGVVSALVPWGWVTMAIVLVPYALLAVLSAAQQSFGYRRWLLFLLLPGLFLVYHISYGTGELWGVLTLALGRAPVQRSSSRRAPSSDRSPRVTRGTRSTHRPSLRTLVARSIAIALSHPFGADNPYFRTGSRERR